MGFLTGQEADWLPRATGILRDELLNIEIWVSSDHSTTLADDLQRGKLDIAFLRPEQKPDLEYKFVAKEPLVASPRYLRRHLGDKSCAALESDVIGDSGASRP
jgi:LysR family transcriptional regulator, hca operon transcriptional activator